MKIGFFTDGYFPQLNGVAVSVAACAHALEKRGHEVYIVAPKYPGVKDKNPRVIRIASVQYPENKDYRVATYLPGKSIFLAKQVDFDIIHGHTGGPVTMLGFEVAKVKRIPFVVTYHTLWNQYVHYIMKGKVITPKMTEIASRIFGNRCDTVVVPTIKVRSELLSYGIDKPIQTVPNGLDLERFLNVKKGWLREKYDIGKDTKVILYVGRLGKEKSIDFLINSFAEIKKTISDSVFVVVGGGTVDKQLKEHANLLGLTDSIIFTGGIEPEYIPGVYKDADVFVFASKTETQGVVVLEAMASGVPTVTVLDDAYREIVEHGVNGSIVGGDEKAFSKEVVRVLNDKVLQETYRKNGKKSVIPYSVDTMAQTLETLYNALIAKNSRKSFSKFVSKYFI